MNRRKNLSFIRYEILTVVKFWLQVSLFRNIMHCRMQKTVFQMCFLYILYLKVYELHPPIVQNMLPDNTVFLIHKATV
jgi:hypothetical protein